MPLSAPQYGPRIRTLRRLQKRTLKDVAQQCGFTVSLLSKIESGKTTPPLATLSKIAAALGIGLSDLLENSKTRAVALTTSQDLAHRPATVTDKGYTFRLLAAQRSDKLMQPILFEARRGQVTPGALSHPGEEFIYVLEGRMQYRVGDTTYTLGPGDSLYFDAEEDHDLQPLSDLVRYLGLFTGRAPASTDTAAPAPPPTTSAASSSSASTS
ncbi:MAG: helix-turn-helix domain-containing protein [Candidatus Methylacidiphilales bacterium]